MRAAISISALVENAARTDATPNVAAPMSSSRRRPTPDQRGDEAVRDEGGCAERDTDLGVMTGQPG